MQSAVDTKHHLIVTHWTTNIGANHGQLSAMALQVFEALREEKTEVLAYKGYYMSEKIGKCEDADTPV